MIPTKEHRFEHEGGAKDLPCFGSSISTLQSLFNSIDVFQTTITMLVSSMMLRLAHGKLE